MKQTAKIILLISGIIDMALLFTVWIPLDVMSVLSSGGIYLFFLPLVIILRFVLFLTGLFSIIAGIKLNKGLCVTTLIFSILSLDVMSLCGAIIGLSALKNQGRHIEVISPDGKRSVVIINDDSQNEVEERPLTGAGKGLKIAGKIALAFNAIGALFTMLVQVLMFTLGPVVMIGGIVYFVFEVIDVMPFTGDMEYIIAQLATPLIFMGVGVVAGFLLVMIASLLLFPTFMSFIFSIIGACQRKNKKGMYITNIVFSLFSLSFLEFLGGVLGTIGVSLKRKKHN